MVGPSSSAAVAALHGEEYFNLLASFKEIPVLMGDNYAEWREKIDSAFIWNDIKWVTTTPQPEKPLKTLRAENETDADWQQRERDYALIEKAYTLSNRQWLIANNKCMALIKNTIEPIFLGSIEESVSTAEYLDNIKSHFTMCLHCHREGHYKYNCPDWLKYVMVFKGIPQDKDYAKKRKMR